MCDCWLGCGSFGCGWRRGAPAFAQDDRVWVGKGKQVPRYARNDNQKSKGKCKSKGKGKGNDKGNGNGRFLRDDNQKVKS